MGNSLAAYVLPKYNTSAAKDVSNENAPCTRLSLKLNLDEKKVMPYVIYRRSAGNHLLDYQERDNS